MHTCESRVNFSLVLANKRSVGEDEERDPRGKFHRFKHLIFPFISRMLLAPAGLTLSRQVLQWSQQ